MTLTMNDLTPQELVDTTSDELSGLRARLDRITMSDDDRLVVNAYLGSIGVRVIVAGIKLRERVPA